MGALTRHGDIGLLQQGLPGVEIGGKRRLDKGGIAKQDQPESIPLARCRKLFKHPFGGIQSADRLAGIGGEIGLGHGAGEIQHDHHIPPEPLAHLRGP